MKWYRPVGTLALVDEDVDPTVRLDLEPWRKHLQSVRGRPALAWQQEAVAMPLQIARVAFVGHVVATGLVKRNITLSRE
jgi:hypothetical protein